MTISWMLRQVYALYKLILSMHDYYSLFALEKDVQATPAKQYTTCIYKHLEMLTKLNHPNGVSLYSISIIKLLFSDPTSGPMYDLRTLQRFLQLHKLPQRTTFICLSPQEVSKDL